MRAILKILSFLLVLSFPSCRLYEVVIHDEDPIARVGDKKLYYSDIEGMVPDFISSADSIEMVHNFIRKWAVGVMYEGLASQYLSDEEQDVSVELEKYRRTLLRYRYEQHYVNERLDTVVTESQMKQYYEAEKNSFILERPILKVRFVDIPESSSDRSRLLKKLGTSNPDEVTEIENLARTSAIRYFDSSEKWMDAAALAKEFDLDWRSMMNSLSGNVIRIDYSQGKDIRMAYVFDRRLSGPAPLEYCSQQIRDIILNSRKHKLLTDLENNLVEDMSRRGEFEILQNGK